MGLELTISKLHTEYFQCLATEIKYIATHD